MDLLTSLDAEISQQVDQMPVEVILALMERWEKEMERDVKDNHANHYKMFKHYVRLKIAWHHLKHKIERDWTSDLNHKYLQQINHYHSAIKQARRNYYVAKRRDEGQHASNCSCRGCRCLRDF